MKRRLRVRDNRPMGGRSDERVATWIPLQGLLWGPLLVLLWLGFLGALVSGGDPGAVLVFGVLRVVATIMLFPMALRVALDADGSVSVLRLLRTVRFAVGDVQSIERLHMRDAPFTWSFWPEYLIRFHGGRVRVPFGPFGSQRFRDAVAARSFGGSATR